MSEQSDLATARAEANAARQRLLAALGAVRHRLTPRALAQSAVAGLRGRSTALAQASAKTARRNRQPLIIVSVILGLIGGGRLILRRRSARSAPPLPKRPPEQPALEGPLHD